MNRRWIFGICVITLLSGGGIGLFELKENIIPPHDPKASRQERLFHEIQVSAPDNLQRMINLTAWIANAIGVTGSGDHNQTIEDVLTVMDGQCGHREWIMHEAAKTLGLKARRIAFVDIPVQQGHTAIEVFIDGAWRFFDPSTGIYFSRPGQTEPLGIAEARSLYPAVTIWQSVEKPYQGKWLPVRKALLQPTAPHMIANPFDGTPMFDIERTYFASTMSGAEEIPVIFSGASIMLDGMPSGMIGHLDGSFMDLHKGGITIGTHDYSMPLMDHIGINDGIALGRRFRFHTSVSTTVSFTMTIIGDTTMPLVDIDHAAPIHDALATMFTTDLHENTLTIKFRALPPYTILRLWMRSGRSIAIDAYQWDSRSPILAKNTLQKKQ